MPCPIHKSAEVLEAKSGLVWFSACIECDYVAIEFYCTKPDDPHQAWLKKVVISPASDKMNPMLPFGRAKDD